MKHILSIPKAELKKSEVSYKKERAAKKAFRGMKLKALAILAFCCLAIPSARADPEERTQMVKARVLQKLVMDGWQLVQESHSLLIVERPAEGTFGFLAQAFMTGANGTTPVVRWSITLVPRNDHYTYYSCVATVNSQNAFGQTKSWPLKNRKDTAYITSVMKYASDGLPQKYKFVNSK